MTAPKPKYSKNLKDIDPWWTSGYHFKQKCLEPDYWCLKFEFAITKRWILCNESTVPANILDIGRSAQLHETPSFMLCSDTEKKTKLSYWTPFSSSSNLIKVLDIISVSFNNRGKMSSDWGSVAMVSHRWLCPVQTTIDRWGYYVRFLHLRPSVDIQAHSLVTFVHNLQITLNTIFNASFRKLFSVDCFFRLLRSSYKFL